MSTRVSFLMKYKFTYWLFLIFLVAFSFSCQRKDLSDLDNRYKSLYEKGVTEWKKLNIEESSSLFLELLTFVDHVNPTEENQRIHLATLNFLGDIISKAGEKKLAYKHIEQALKLAEKYNNEPYQIQAMLNMAKLEEKPIEVERILHETETKFGANRENKYPIDQINYALALLYSKNERTEDAIYTFNKLLMHDHPDRLKSYIHKGLGISFRNKGDFKSASENFDKALEFCEDINKSNELNILIEKGEIYIMSNEFEKFDKLITEIKPTIDTIQNLNLKKRLNELRLNLYNQTNNINGKVEVLSELIPLNEKIYKKSNASLGNIALNLKHYELKKETEAQKELTNQLKISLALASLLFLLATSLFILYYKFYKKQSQLQLLEKEQKLKELENEKALESIYAYMNGQEEERKQHAAQLHDSLGANLAAVNMHLSLLKKDVPEKKYERISGMLKNVITETRNISHNIMPPLLVNQGVIAAISEKAIEWSLPELQFEVESNIERVALNDSLEIALYRGILECVNNIIRSAEASHAKIIFEQLENNTLQITIADNGKGFDVGIIERGEGGLGINGVKNRIKYFKGNFNIDSEIGKGTTVYISVPVLKMKQTA